MYIKDIKTKSYFRIESSLILYKSFKLYFLLNQSLTNEGSITDSTKV